jgi:mRNA interferase RelE/StbE
MSKAKNTYIIQSVKDLQNDLLQLPPKLQQKLQNYQKILALDPYQTLEFPSHSLTGKLKGCCA